MKKLFILCLALTGASASAAPICFSDKASYEKVKASLPPSMRKGAVFLVYSAESGLLKAAAAKIVPSGKGYVFQMAYDHKIVGTSQESGTIKQVCVNGDKVDVTLASGTKKQLIASGKGFSYQGFNLASTSSAKYTQVYQSIVGSSGSAADGTKAKR